MPFLVIGLALTLSNGKEPITLLTSNMKSGYWFLLTLFECFLLHYVGLVIFSNLKKNNLIFDISWSIVVLFLLYVFNSNFGSSIIAIILGLFHLYKYYPYFLVASLLNKYDLHRKVLGSEILFTIAFIALAVSIIMLGSNVRIRGFSFLLNLSYLYLCVSTMYRIENLSNTVLSVLSYLGRNSIYIYVFHYFFIIHTSLSFIQPSPNNTSLVLDIVMISAPTLLIICFSLSIGWMIKECTMLHKLIFGRK